VCPVSFSASIRTIAEFQRTAVLFRVSSSATNDSLPEGGAMRNWIVVAGTDTLSDKPEKNTAKLNKAVVKMFEQYPPTQK
jgi:hypothetical protein